jgi:hypothetical protein
VSDRFWAPDPHSSIAADRLEVHVEPSAGPAGLPPAATPASGLPTPRHRPFNGFLRLKDPIDLAGVWLSAFSLNLLIPLDPRTRPEQVTGFIASLYQDVYHAMRQRVAGVVDLEIAAFDDVKVSREPPRNQIRATLRTARQSQVTTLFRCYATEHHLYVAADSYRLGPLNWVSLLFRLSIAGALLFVLLPFVVVGWVIWALVFVLLFGRAIRGIRLYGWDVGLRGAFPRSAIDSSFDTDDCLMYLKALMPTVVRAIRSSAETYGIDVSALDGPLSALEVKYFVTNYTNSGNGVMNLGGVIGEVVAGQGNRTGGTGGTP